MYKELSILSVPGVEHLISHLADEDMEPQCYMLSTQLATTEV